MSEVLVETPQPSREELFKEAITVYFWRLLVDQKPERQPSVGLNHDDLVQYVADLTPEQLHGILPKSFRDLLTTDCVYMTTEGIIEHLENVVIDVAKVCKERAGRVEYVEKLQRMGLDPESDSDGSANTVVLIGSTATKSITDLDEGLLKTA